MASRQVLTVNQVLEIMLHWLEVGDWEKAFMAIIPKRKLPEKQDRQDSEVDIAEESDIQGHEDGDANEAGVNSAHSA